MFSGSIGWNPNPQPIGPIAVAALGAIGYRESSALRLPARGTFRVMMAE